MTNLFKLKIMEQQKMRFKSMVCKYITDYNKTPNCVGAISQLLYAYEFLYYDRVTIGEDQIKFGNTVVAKYHLDYDLNLVVFTDIISKYKHIEENQSIMIDGIKNNWFLDFKNQEGIKWFFEGANYYKTKFLYYNLPFVDKEKYGKVVLYCYNNNYPDIVIYSISDLYNLQHTISNKFLKDDYYSLNGIVIDSNVVKTSKNIFGYDKELVNAMLKTIREHENNN